MTKAETECTGSTLLKSKLANGDDDVSQSSTVDLNCANSTSFDSHLDCCGNYSEHSGSSTSHESVTSSPPCSVHDDPIYRLDGGIKMDKMINLQSKGSYFGDENQTFHANHRQSRTPRRNSSTKNKNRFSASRYPGYYPCCICYGYPQVSEYTRHQRNTRSRSQSGQSNSTSNSVNSVLSLSECAYLLYSNYRKRSNLYSFNNEECQILNVGQRQFDLRDVRFDVLTFDQVRCLNGVLEQTIKIKSDLHVEVVEFSLMNLIMAVKDRLLKKNIVLYDIRLNGGAASHVLSLSSSVYNDIDLIFFVDLKNSDQFERVRESVLEVLLELIPASICERRRVIETYVNKMVKIDEVDRWSLISLLNYAGRNVELKFVDSMRRQYEFSVDSFQIVLDTLLQFCLVNSDSNPMTYNFYPTVVGESMFGNFSEAMFHLHHRLIVTKKPEEIRGGGLLKYCSLLVRNFYPIDEYNVKILEPYMSTRFFIDFFYQDCQRDRLNNYLTTHFGNNSLLKYNFMIIFLNIIRRSSSLASHHQSAMHDFEKITMECYSKVLFEYLNLYLSDYSKVQEFFMRCQDMRVCHCPRNLRSCIHRYLNQVYSITSPVIVTFVDDVISNSVSKDERKKNLAKFIEVHDDIYPVYGGYSFAFLPSVLFDCPEANHYVVTSSTLNNIPSARFVRPQHYTADYMCTFLMKTTENGQSLPNESLSLQHANQQPSQQSQQPMIQIIPLAIQNLLPESFYPLEYANPNLITPALAFHFFPPVAPLPSYRLCIVNRIPINYSETVASGPIFNSQVVAMHFPQPQAPSSQPMTPASESQPMNISQYKLSQIYQHMHPHNPHHHHHHHHHHHMGHYPQMQYGHCSSNPNNSRSRKHSFHQQSPPIYFQTVMPTPPLEPLRIIYPRPPPTMDKIDNGSDRNEANCDNSISIPQITINDNVIDLNSLTEAGNSCSKLKVTPNKCTPKESKKVKDKLSKTTNKTVIVA